MPVKVFTNSPQYKNVNIAICVLAVVFEIYWTTEVSNLGIQYSYTQWYEILHLLIQYH